MCLYKLRRSAERRHGYHKLPCMDVSRLSAWPSTPVNWPYIWHTDRQPLADGSIILSTDHLRLVGICYRQPTDMELAVQTFARPTDPIHGTSAFGRLFKLFCSQSMLFSALTLLVGRQEGQPVCKNWAVGCRRVCLEWGANLYMAQLMPLPLTVSCFT